MKAVARPARPQAGWTNRLAAVAALLACLTAGGCGASSDPAQTEGCCVGPAGEPITGEAEYAAVLEQLQAAGRIPEGMTLIPGGWADIGSETGLPHERPVFTVRMAPFLMDREMVTVGEFREFIERTGYVTEAEQIGDGIRFEFDRGEWAVVPGLTWEFPAGPEAGTPPDDHPVTMVSYRDAAAYLEWAGKRLPTEVEWEHAARGVTSRETPYAWNGYRLDDGQGPNANTWTGSFPSVNTASDGWLRTSPVGAYGRTELGLADMGGNVWEWTSSWYRPYSERDRPFTPRPESEKVLRGGSFMCHVSYCHGYRVSARSHTPPSNTMFHIGFRGVMEIPDESPEAAVSADVSLRPDVISAPSSTPVSQAMHVEAGPVDTPVPVVAGAAVGRFRIGERIAHSDFTEPDEWTVQIEDKPGDSLPDPEIRFAEGRLDVFMPGRGATIWRNQPLEGPVAIVYTARVPTARMAGMDPAVIMPRDLNVFWHASGPEGGSVLDGARYTGRFQSYHKQRGYYASTGGGSNTTTRFRRYPRTSQGEPVPHIALIDKDGDPGHLLPPDRDLTIQLVAWHDLAQYLVDGRVVYELAPGDTVRVENPDGSSQERVLDREAFSAPDGGWFGFRLLKSHHVFSDFAVYRLHPAESELALAR